MEQLFNDYEIEGLKSISRSTPCLDPPRVRRLNVHSVCSVWDGPLPHASKHNTMHFQFLHAAQELERFFFFAFFQGGVSLSMEKGEVL